MMNTNDKYNLISKYFNAGTAESDAEILQEAFVEEGMLEEVITVPYPNPRILVGKKGSGKSAIINYVNNKNNSMGLVSILIKPSDMTNSSSADYAMGYLIAESKKTLITSIATKLAEEKSNKLANSDYHYLRELSREHTGNDIIESFAEKINNLNIFNISMEMEQKNEAMSTSRASKCISNILKKEKRLFSVFIDDVDQIFSSTEDKELNRLWALILASRELMMRIKELRITIAVRTDIWYRVEKNSSSHRDQIDHFLNSIKHLNQTETEVKNIIRKRVELFNAEFGKELKSDSLYNNIFSSTARIPIMEDIYRSWEDMIVKNSRERPRDAIQLIAQLAEDAKLKKSEYITSSELTKVLPVYSEKRVDLLENELEFDCPSIRTIIESFVKVEWDEGSFTCSPELMRKTLEAIISVHHPILYGIVLQDELPKHVFELWRFLFIIGFFSGRRNDNREAKGYSHINASDNKDFVRLDNWNDMQKVTWEINSAYRFFIMHKQKENEFCFKGRPSKSQKKKNVR